MRVIHIGGMRDGPLRVLLVVFDQNTRRPVANAEWIVICEGAPEIIATRFRNALARLSNISQCTAVTSDVRTLLSKHGVSLPQGWESLDIF